MHLSRTSTAALLASLALLGGALNRASADVITFQDRSGPSTFGNPGQTLTYTGTSAGTVTFKGGTVLSNTANLPADQTTLYGTCGVPLCGVSSYGPITITFSSPINNFFLDLYNGQTHADTFTVSDNMGQSTTVLIAPNTSSGLSLISFPAVGNMVTISTTDTSYDYFIDNVGFDQATPGVTPEPSSLLLVATGLLGAGASLRRRFVKA